MRAMMLMLVLALLVPARPVMAQAGGDADSKHYRTPAQVAKFTDPMMGLWRMDWSKQTVNGVQRDPATLGQADEWLNCTPFGLNGISVDAEIIRPDGTVFHQIYRGQFDSKPVPIAGDNSAASVSLTRPDPHRMIVVSYDKDGKANRTRTFVVSTDGMVKVNRMEGVDAQGNRTETVFYLYRQ